MKYCIGEFSSILGITRDTLRLYEKHEIVKPIKDLHNRYRYFNDLDARDLLMSRWYRSLQIPLHDVAELMKNSSLETISEKIGESIDQLEEEIRKSTMLLNKLEELNQEIHSIEGSLCQCTIRKMPGLYRFKQTNKNDLLKNEGLENIVNSLMEQLPFTFYCFRIGKDQMLKEGADSFDYSWGLTLSEDDLPKLKVEISDHLEYIAPSTCVSAVITSPCGEYLSKEYLQFMLDYLDEHQYMISGDVVGKLILTENNDGNKRSYLQVNIPICQGC